MRVPTSSLCGRVSRMVSIHDRAAFRRGSPSSTCHHTSRAVCQDGGTDSSTHAGDEESPSSRTKVNKHTAWSDPALRTRHPNTRRESRTTQQNQTREQARGGELPNPYEAHALSPCA